MSAIELFHQDGKSADTFYCSECRAVARSKESAEACCAPCSCGQPTKYKGRRECSACDDLTGVEELTEAVNKFNEANREAPVVYYLDWKRMVRLPKVTA